MPDRCQGNETPGAWTGFQCVLDEGHDGFCKPYVPPTVDEWRQAQAEITALQAALRNCLEAT